MFSILLYQQYNDNCGISHLYYSISRWLLFLFFRECSRRVEDFFFLLWNSPSFRKVFSMVSYLYRQSQLWRSFETVWFISEREIARFTGDETCSLFWNVDDKFVVVFEDTVCSRGSFRCAMWQLLSIFILYPALFFFLPIFFLYIFPTDSSDSPIGSYLLIRKTESQTIYYSTPSLKIFSKGQKLLYRQQLFLLVDSWVSKKNVHYLRYRSIETGVTYSFIWQSYTNLLRLNGETSQEFIRDGTKDYIKNLSKDSITSLEGTGYEKWERPKEELEPFSWQKRTRKKLYKGLR